MYGREKKRKHKRSRKEKKRKKHTDAAPAIDPVWQHSLLRLTGAALSSSAGSSASHFVTGAMQPLPGLPGLPGTQPPADPKPPPQ